MSLLSSPDDFDPRILINEPLMFLHWYTNPDLKIFRTPRTVIPLSTRLVRRNNQVHLPLSNEQILSIRTHYYLEWQLLTITTLALVIAYFMFNPLLLFYVRFESDKSLDSQYASLLYIIFYGSCIVSIVFWMFISRLSIWHSTFNTARHYIEESKRSSTTLQRKINATPNNQSSNRRNKNSNNRRPIGDESDSEASDDGGNVDGNGDNNLTESKEDDMKQSSDNSSQPQPETTDLQRPMYHSSRQTGSNNNDALAATTRVTGFIVAMRWTLFGYALSLGIFAAAETYSQLIMASVISGVFFPVLLVTSSNVIVYQMKRLPSVKTDLSAMYWIIICGWIFVPLITCIIGEYLEYRWPFVAFAVLLLLFMGFTMLFQPGQPTISMIAEKENDIMDESQQPDSIGLNQSLTGTNAGYDDTTPLRAGGGTMTESYDDDDTSSVISDASSIFRMPGDREPPTNLDNQRPIRGAGANNNQKLTQQQRYEIELRRAGIDVTPEDENDEDRPKCGCFENRVCRKSCEYNHRLMSSSMGVFQIATFLLLIQTFCIDICISAYLTWYPIVMYDAFDQRFIITGVQMFITGLVVIFFATWVARRNTTQFFLYSVNIFGSFFVILLTVSMIEFSDVIFYWFLFPLIMGCIVLIGMISRMMLSRITPNGCLSFINGSQQIFHLAAFGIGPLILGIVNSFGNNDSDYYFFSLFYCLLAVHVCSTLGLYCVQLTFTAIKVWGLSTYQNRP